MTLTSSQGAWLSRLRQLVECESPTEEATAVNRAMDQLRLGGRPGWARAPCGTRRLDYGDVVELWFDAPGE